MELESHVSVTSLRVWVFVLKGMDGTGFLSSGEARLDFYSMWRADWRSCSPPHKTGWWFSLGNDARGGKWRDWRLSL